MFTGWYSFLGMSNTDYPILIIYNSDIIIFNLYYNMVQKQIKYQLKSNSIQMKPISTLSRKGWYFLKIQVILGQTEVSTKDTVNILFEGYFY